MTTPKKRYKALTAFIALTFTALPSCSESHKPCRPGCVDESTKLECDDDGTAHSEPCPTASNACAAPSCVSGECTFHPAVNAPCGPTGLARCNEGYACIGPDARITAILQHTCLLADDGMIWCWGYNGYGELGDGTTDDKGRPVAVRHLPGPAVDVSAGYAHTCAILEGGSVYCWGMNIYGQTAPGDIAEKILEPRKVEADVKFRSVHAGRVHTCAITDDDAVYCWGNTAAGQCGVDDPSTVSVGPTRIPDLGEVSMLETVKDHTCALEAASSTVRCWGSNIYLEDGAYVDNKLGPATAATHSALPVEIELPEPVVDVGMSYESSYAVTASGLIYAWGYNGSLQLGTARPDRSYPDPAPVLESLREPLRGATDVLRTDGSDQCAAVETNGDREYYCWGNNDFGELGLGAPASNVLYATRVTRLPNNTTQVVRGENHACAIAGEAGHEGVYCYGLKWLTGTGTFDRDAVQVEPASVLWDASDDLPLPQ